jgi:hypothetical protein
MDKSRSLYCRATVNYTDETGLVPTGVDILDGRVAKDSLDWQQCGFDLVSHVSRVVDWHDWAALELVCYDEITSLARSLTGCDAVIFDGCVLRSREMGQLHADLGPAKAVHTDYTEGYREMIQNPNHPYSRIMAPSMARAGISIADIERAERVLVLQFWRNVGPVDMDYPMAFCDARSVRRSSLREIHGSTFGDVQVGYDVFALEPPPEPEQYRWYAFPRMTVDEVVVWRGYDDSCVERDEPFWTPHTAFLDPNTGPHAPGRVSLEMRATCLFHGHA